ncbi:MAG: acetyltransferase [Coriobacteriia bacterium]|nr:acetyltransferase [Coriobacteriia bacterium]
MKLLVVGAGGHAKVVIDAARDAGWDVVGVIGAPRERPDVLGVPISATADGIDADAFIVAVGDNRQRAALFAENVAAGRTPAAVVHPSAIIGTDVTIGAGAFIAPGVIVNVDATVGVNSILNTGCSVDHDCAIGAHAHVGPGSALCGGVRLGEGVLLGVGCSVIPLRSVGDWATVGAGATVVDDVPASATYAGVPAKPLHGSES